MSRTEIDQLLTARKALLGLQVGSCALLYATGRALLGRARR